MAAAINVIDPGSVARALTGVSVIDPNGTNRNLLEIRVIDTGGVDRLVFGGGGSLVVSATPALIYTPSTVTGSITCSSTTAAAANGTPAYSYAWTLLDYDNVVPPTITAPGAAMTSFKQSNIGYGESYTATFRVTATDSVPNTATADVTVTWEHVPSGGGDGGGRFNR